MNQNELIKKISEIIFSVPGEIYKFQPPEDCFEGEWEAAPMEERAFLLIEELLINFNREKCKQSTKDQGEDGVKIEIQSTPRFYTQADENMFFTALNSIPSIMDIKGLGRGC